MSNDHETLHAAPAAEEVAQRYPHSRLGVFASLVFLILATSAVILLFQDSLGTAFAFFLPLTLGAAIVIVLLKLPRFQKASLELLKSGTSRVATASGRRTTLQSLLLLVGAALYIYIPLVLAGSIPPLFWISPLMGVIAGTSLGELAHTGYVRVWERKNKCALFTAYKYEFDSLGKPRLKRISMLLLRSSD